MKQSNTVFNVTKWLSILCLVTILASAFLPWITLTGEYQQLFLGIEQAAETIPEEGYDMAEEMLRTQGIEIDFQECFDAIFSLTEPLEDGQISVMDFVALSQKTSAISKSLSGIPLDGLGISADETDPVMQGMGEFSEMLSSLAQMGQTMGMLSNVFLIPVAVFGLLAFAVVVRILLRLFNRRGLGVLISLLSILNAAFMMGLAYMINYIASEGLPIGAEYTMVPIVVVVCSIVSCILWGIGRGRANAVVKEETPAVQETPVVETPVVEETVEDETEVVEESTEETTEEATEEVTVEETEEALND